MNKLKAEISDIRSSGDIHLVTLNFEAQNFYSLILDAAEDYIKPGNPVYIVFKETEVSIAKDLSGQLSLRNRLKSTITSIKKGDLLSEIKLDFKGHKLTSIITTGSCENLQLKEGDKVEGLIKTNELMLMKC